MRREKWEKECGKSEREMWDIQEDQEAQLVSATEFGFI